MINVLFVCIGNSCRSQMAEGFARKYGADVMHAWSAGWAPAAIVQPLTIHVMQQKNIDIHDQFPKSLHEMDLNAFDAIVNISGQPMPPGVRGEVVTWNVADPINQPEELYVKVRDQIEGLVMQLVMSQRRGSRAAPSTIPRTTPKPAAKSAPAKKTAAPQRYGFGRIRPVRD